MSILVTGGTGFLGKSLLPKLDGAVYVLSRDPSKKVANASPITGDVLKGNLGIADVPTDIESVYHLAGLINLGEDKTGIVRRTNVEGTRHVLDFCILHKVKHLYFVSTAYTLGRNPYECSKMACEDMIRWYSNKYGLKTTIFKPSIVVDPYGMQRDGHVSRFISLIIAVHRRAELVRRWVEGTLGLPPINPSFRIAGNPDGVLNLVPVDCVTDHIAKIRDEGVYWITNPDPPILSDMVKWIGQCVALDIKFVRELKPTVIEKQFARLVRPFQSYLYGDCFPSDVEFCMPITAEVIRKMVLSVVP